MFGFAVKVEKDDKKAELEIQGFHDQDSVEEFAHEVRETLVVCLEENEEITGFEVGEPGPMEERQDVPEVDIQDFTDELVMQVMTPEPGHMVKGEYPLRFAVEHPIEY